MNNTSSSNQKNKNSELTTGEAFLLVVGSMIGAALLMIFGSKSNALIGLDFLTLVMGGILAIVGVIYLLIIGIDWIDSHDPS